MHKQLQISGANCYRNMADNKLRLQRFRANDLVDNGGKQFELGKSWCEDFFGISPDAKEVTLSLTFKPLNKTHKNLDGTKVELLLSDVTARGDRKAYANSEKAGCSQIKDLFKTEIPKISVERKSAKKDLICEESLQQIFYGAPGTGKSHTIKEQTEGESVIRTTFHPDSDYSTFVGAYKPTMGLLPICDELGQPMKIGSTILHKEQIVYEFVDQAFLQAYIKAWQFYAEANGETPKNQYLIIEEINRGNCAQIFGDLFQLLDRNDRGFSDYPINADKDMKNQLAKAFKGITIAQTDEINAYYRDEDAVGKVLKGEILLLPNNLYIWATMNTSDQSLFPIDSAFKRRWDWQYMPIGKGYDENGNEYRWTIEVSGKKYGWWSFLEKINAQISEVTQSEDKKLGFFFCKAENNVLSADLFVGKVLFYLWNDVFKDYGFEGEIFKDTDGTELSFAKFYESDAKGNAIVQEDKVEVFLKNLRVETDGESDEEALEAAITGGTVDRSKYSFNGDGKEYGKSVLGRTIMEKFIKEHPELTIAQLKQTFPDSMLNGVPGPGLIVEESVGLASYSRYYSSGYISNDGIKYSIYKQWTIGNIQNIIDFAEKQNWKVDKL